MTVRGASAVRRFACYPGAVRWLSSIVVLCLLAAGGARPAPAARDAHAHGQLVAPDGIAPQLTVRRSAAVPEQRLAPFVLAPRAPGAECIASVGVVETVHAVVRPAIAVRRAHAARGPPRA